MAITRVSKTLIQGSNPCAPATNNPALEQDYLYLLSQSKLYMYPNGNMFQDFSIKAAKSQAKSNGLDTWAYDFLNGPGKNKEMARGMQKRRKKDKLFWLGPIFFPLKEMERCCGPEAKMEFVESQKDWEKRVGKLVVALKKGWEAPVLIVNPRPWPVLSVRDGNHRHEALKRMKKRKYWTLFWFDSEKDRVKFIRKYKISHSSPF